MTVKHNQGKLYRDLEMLFSYDQQQDFQDVSDGEETIKTRFYISSLEADAKRILKSTR